MSKASTKLEDLKAGDLIYVDVIIKPADIADINSKSTTTGKAKRGKPVRRICIVLVPGQKSVEVTYVATFTQSTTLPTGLDKTMWYPFDPAEEEEGALEPLPAMSDGKAQWASLRTKQTITKRPNETVEKIVGMSVPATTVNLIKQNMKA